MTGKYLDNMELKCSPGLNGGLIKMSAFIQVDYLRARQLASCGGRVITLQYFQLTGAQHAILQWRSCGKNIWSPGIGSHLVHEWFLVKIRKTEVSR